MKATINTPDSRVVKRPSSEMPKQKQNLCPDKRYDFQDIERDVIKRGYIPHIRHRGEQLLIMNKNGVIDSKSYSNNNEYNSSC